ncbi:MAG TPA: ATP-binding protein [Kofleriaceae bacterium]
MAAKPRAAKLDAQRLLHELEVHQVELEAQNEELRGTRRELEAALARYTELFDFAPIGYATIDRDDVIRNVNHAGSRLLGAPRGRLVGARFRAQLHRDDAAAFAAIAASVRTYDEPADCELRLRGASPASQIVLHVTATVQPRDPGILLLAFEDVTLRKAEQEQLAATARALRAADQRKDEFLAMLSHELRNPLTPIRTSLFVLSRSEHGSQSATDARAIIERQITHMTRLVDDLLDVTRIIRGKIRLQRERVDLAELVRHAVEDYRPAFDASQIALGNGCATSPIWADVDGARIVQAVSNLLGNAHKFTPAGGRVDVELRRRGAVAELRVRDTGSGIAPELLSHVFEPFTQAPQTLDRRSGGLGLGLAMVKGLVELHGGSVRIASDGVARGTEIIIALPVTTSGAEEVVPALPELTSRRVLVIEDQPDAALALETALTMLGLEVRTAGSGRAGLELARTFHPDVVLCDIGLPGMSGHEVARAFRTDRDLRDTHLVALSGYAQPEDVESATAAGFSRHLAKPASLEALIRAIALAPHAGSA